MLFRSRPLGRRSPPPPPHRRAALTAGGGAPALLLALARSLEDGGERELGSGRSKSKSDAAGIRFWKPVPELSRLAQGSRGRPRRPHIQRIGVKASRGARSRRRLPDVPATRVHAGSMHRCGQPVRRRELAARPGDRRSGDLPGSGRPDGRHGCPRDVRFEFKPLPGTRLDVARPTLQVAVVAPAASPAVSVSPRHGVDRQPVRGLGRCRRRDSISPAPRSSESPSAGRSPRHAQFAAPISPSLGWPRAPGWTCGRSQAHRSTHVGTSTPSAWWRAGRRRQEPDAKCWSASRCLPAGRRRGSGSSVVDPRWRSPVR